LKKAFFWSECWRCSSTRPVNVQIRCFNSKFDVRHQITLSVQLNAATFLPSYFLSPTRLWPFSFLGLDKKNLKLNWLVGKYPPRRRRRRIKDKWAWQCNYTRNQMDKIPVTVCEKLFLYLAPLTGSRGHSRELYCVILPSFHPATSTAKDHCYFVVRWDFAYGFEAGVPRHRHNWKPINIVCTLKRETSDSLC